MHARHPRSVGTARNHRHRRPPGRGTRIVTRSLLALTGIGVVVASGLTMVSLSGAASGGHRSVVVFGDSYYSTPDAPALQRPCAQSEHNWPRLAEERTGVTVHDWSCGGATSASLLDHVKESLVAGDLGQDTGTVFLSVGGNDFAHQDAVRGGTVDDLEGRRDIVLANVSTAVGIIRATAPGARLVMSSYLPSTVGPYVCRTAGPVQGVSLPVYDPDLDAVEAYISETMALAAQQHGADFVDLRAAAEGNSTCSPVGSRFVSGEQDGAADVLMAWHPTQAGAVFMADSLIPHFAD